MMIAFKFPVLGTRFIHTSEGRLLVDRLIPCNLCAAEAIAPFNRTNDAKSRKDGETSTTVAEVTESPESGRIHLFSIEECILQGRRQARMAHNQASDPLSLSIDSATRQTTTNHTDDAFMCPRHSDGPLSLAAMAPDTLFTDLDNSFVVSPANVRRGQLVGRGAFGFVFNGLIRRQRGDAYAEVALKIFEPVDPSSGSMVISSVSDDISAQSIPVARRAGDSQRVSARAAFEAYRLKWQNDTLEHATHAYCTVRQELRMLTGLRYAHVTALVGFCAAPMMLIVELAPHGALNAVLTRYRRAGARLASNTLQQTCVQIARALEYLHANRIIYRDLKSENVLVWRFPTPHVAGRPSDSVLLPSASILPVSSIPMIQNAGARGNVHLKLGDYGISRVSHPGGICKGYGGTEGFMAPEIMRYSGEQPYTDLVDSYSFGMFLYELISLRQPYEGLDQMKEFILEGRRPYVSEKELLHPTSVLDLIVVCWSESPIERPTASQLVGICGAPEFSRLMDVAVLDERHVEDREMSQIRNLKDVKIRSNSAFSSSKNHHTALATVVVTDLSLSQVWFITCGQMPNDGRICVLAASQYGWTEHRILESSGLLPPAEVDAFSQADTNEVWLAGVDGTIRVYSTRTFEVLGKFLPTQFIEKISKRKSTDHNNMASSAIAKDLNALRTNVKALPSQNIISLSTSSRKGSTVKRSTEDSKTMQSDPQSLDIKNRSEDDRRIPLSSRHRVKDIQPYSARGLVVLALSNHVLVLRLLPALSDDFSVSVSNGETFTPPILIEAIEMADDCEIISLAVFESTDEWQIWTSHDAGRLIVHHINGFTDRLVYSTSVRHFDAEDSAAVNFVVPSFSGAPLVWTCLEDDPRIFQWRASAPLAISRTLNCAKILPESESLSSMDSAVIRNVHITAMQLVTPMAGAGGEKLIVGTNHGVVIIVDAEQMLPLSSFRPHLSAVEQILVCSDAKTSAMFSDDTQLAATVSEASPYAERRRSSATGTARRELVQMRDALGGNVKKFIVPAPTPGPKWRLPAALRSRFSPRPAIVQSKSSYTLPAVAGELAETVARGVKDILTSPATNETSNLAPAGRDPFAEEITFVTIGSDYRCLLGRFLSSESEALGTSDTYRKTFALFWRSDGWTCK